MWNKIILPPPAPALLFSGGTHHSVTLYWSFTTVYVYKRVIDPIAHVKLHSSYFYSHMLAVFLPGCWSISRNQARWLSRGAGMTPLYCIYTTHFSLCMYIRDWLTANVQALYYTSTATFEHQIEAQAKSEQLSGTFGHAVVVFSCLYIGLSSFYIHIRGWLTLRASMDVPLSNFYSHVLTGFLSQSRFQAFSQVAFCLKWWYTIM